MIALIVQGVTIADIETQLGIKRATIYEWKRSDAGFVEMLDQAETAVTEALITEGVHQAEQKVKDLLPLAAEVIETALNHADPKVRLQAAGMVMRFSKPQDGLTVNVGLEARLLQVQGNPAAGD